MIKWLKRKLTNKFKDSRKVPFPKRVKSRKSGFVEGMNSNTYSLNGTYATPVDGTYLVIDKDGEHVKTLKKGDKVELKDANSVSRIK